jgi:hypothetical protein
MSEFDSTNMVLSAEERMPEDIDVNRFALVAILVAANAKHPTAYPDYETLNEMSDSGLLAYADGLLYSLEHSSPPKDEVAAEVRDGLRRVIRGGEQPGRTR